MSEVKHRIVETNGIRMYLAEQGTGPLVVLCHGFPESWYSWRHQLGALAEAGFHAVAPDMRGYGQTDRPEEIEKYTLLHLVGDMVGLLDALGTESAVIIGHDWGAPVAWHAALLRPDRFRGVVGLSVPFRPRGQARPTTMMPQNEDAIFYQLYFQNPGVAEAEFERDPRMTVRALLYSASGDAPRREDRASAENVGMVPRQGGFLTRLLSPATLPPWLTEADVDFYGAEFKRTGFRGGLNWYRNIDRNWEILAPFAGARVTIPALYMAGDRDLVVSFRGMDQLIPNLAKFVPRSEGQSCFRVAATGPRRNGRTRLMPPSSNSFEACRRGLRATAVETKRALAFVLVAQHHASTTCPVVRHWLFFRVRNQRPPRRTATAFDWARQRDFVSGPSRPFFSKHNSRRSSAAMLLSSGTRSVAPSPRTSRMLAVRSFSLKGRSESAIVTLLDSAKALASTD